MHKINIFVGLIAIAIFIVFVISSHHVSNIESQRHQPLHRSDQKCAEFPKNITDITFHDFNEENLHWTYRMTLKNNNMIIEEGQVIMRCPTDQYDMNIRFDGTQASPIHKEYVGRTVVARQYNNRYDEITPLDCHNNNTYAILLWKERGSYSKLDVRANRTTIYHTNGIDTWYKDIDIFNSNNTVVARMSLIRQNSSKLWNIKIFSTQESDSTNYPIDPFILTSITGIELFNTKNSKGENIYDGCNNIFNKMYLLKIMSIPPFAMFTFLLLYVLCTDSSCRNMYKKCFNFCRQYLNKND